MADIKGYFAETYNELVNKVTWPSWAELQSSAIIVLVASLMIALSVWIMDYFFGINSSDSLWRGALGIFYKLVGVITQ